MTIERRLWLAAHLLFPKEAQADETYKAVLSQAKSLTGKIEFEQVYVKLNQALEKNPPVNSSHPFSVFDLEEIEIWKSVYKNSTYQQLSVFFGAAFFDLKTSQISNITKIPLDKVEFLLNQIFKKQFPVSNKINHADVVSKNLPAEQKVSYHYTYENLVSYTLMILPAAEQQKVAMGLEQNPTLQVIQHEYNKFLKYINTLKSVSEMKSKVAEIQNAQQAAVVEQNLQKKKSVTTKTLVIVLAALILVVAAIQLFNKPEFKTESAQEPNAPTYLAPADQEDIATESVSDVASSEISTAEAEALAASEDATALQAAQQLAEKLAAEADAKAKADLEAAAKKQKEDDEKAAIVAADLAKKEVIKEEVIKEVATFKTETYEGGLYRASLIISKGIDAKNSEIIKKVKALKAEKAGEVELGWMKTPKMSYFHYLIPSKNASKAEAIFKKYGKYTVKFEKHPRAIPVDSKRYIIEVFQK